MHPAWPLVALSTVCIASCTIDEPFGPAPSSGSGAVTISSTGVTESGETGGTDTGGEAGLDVPGCDLLADPLEACGPAMACDPETSTCVAANGVGVVDDPCADSTECTPGLVCFDDRCRELCAPEIAGEDTCEGDRVCTRADAPLPGICLEPCVLLAQVCSAPGDACNRGVSSGGATVAVCTSNPGAGIDGDACERDGECLPSYLCTPAQLHSVPCANDAAACCTPSCDVFEQPCFGLEPTCNLLGIEGQPGAGVCGP